MTAATFCHENSAITSTLTAATGGSERWSLLMPSRMAEMVGKRDDHLEDGRWPYRAIVWRPDEVHDV